MLPIRAIIRGYKGGSPTTPILGAFFSFSWHFQKTFPIFWDVQYCPHLVQCCTTHITWQLSQKNQHGMYMQSSADCKRHFFLFQLCLLLLKVWSVTQLVSYLFTMVFCEKSLWYTQDILFNCCCCSWEEDLWSLIMFSLLAYLQACLLCFLLRYHHLTCGKLL